MQQAQQVPSVPAIVLFSTALHQPDFKQVIILTSAIECTLMSRAFDEKNPKSEHMTYPVIELTI